MVDFDSITEKRQLVVQLLQGPESPLSCHVEPDNHSAIVGEVG
jgi:hypothetical protein